MSNRPDPSRRRPAAPLTPPFVLVLVLALAAGAAPAAPAVLATAPPAPATGPAAPEAAAAAPHTPAAPTAAPPAFEAPAAGASPAASAAFTAAAHSQELARRVFERIFSRGDMDLIALTYAPDFVDYSRGGGKGPELIRTAVAGWRASCPNLQITVDDLLADGSKVVVRWTATGTQTGAWNGLPPTNRTVHVGGLTVFEFAAGRIAKEWTQFDRLGLYEQLGLAMAPAAAPPTPPANH